MFFDLADILSKREERQFYDLTAADLRLLKHLRHTDGWKVFLKLIDTRAKVLGETLMHIDQSRLGDVRAEIRGLRSAPSLVDHILTQEAVLDEHRARQSESREPKRGSNLFGPFAGRTRVKDTKSP